MKHTFQKAIQPVAEYYADFSSAGTIVYNIHY